LPCKAQNAGVALLRRVFATAQGEKRKRQKSLPVAEQGILIMVERGLCKIRLFIKSKERHNTLYIKKVAVIGFTATFL
jgi:hypothetical protein